MSVADTPTLIVEAALSVGASTSGFFTIGDSSRGVIGTGLIGPDQVFTDITAYVESFSCTAGSSSRVTNPLVQFEAGTLTVLLNNLSRAFDPLNVASPFYSNGSSVIVPVPGTLPNADPALFSMAANDAQVLSVSAGVTNAPAEAATFSFAGNNATVTGTTTTVNTPSGMLFGSSAGGGGAGPENATQTLLHPKIWRSFEQDPATYSATAYMRFAPNNVQQICSFKLDTAVMADTSNAGYAAMVARQKTVLGGLSAIKGHWTVVHHEPYGDGLPAGQWQQAQINYRRDVLDPVNLTRTNPIFFMNPMNGFITPAQADVFFTPAVLAVMDAIGWDCYGYNTGQDQFLRGHEYALSKGMPLIIPELGSMTGGTASSTTDAQELAVMQSVMGHIASFSQADRPIAVCWFNGNSSAVGGKPNAAAYWQNVCDTSSVAP